MNVFEKLRAGQSFHVRDDEDYVREAYKYFGWQVLPKRWIVERTFA